MHDHRGFQAGIKSIKCLYAFQYIFPLMVFFHLEIWKIIRGNTHCETYYSLFYNTCLICIFHCLQCRLAYIRNELMNKEDYSVNI